MEKQKEKLKLVYAFFLVGQLGVMVVILIGLGLALGVFLDKTLKTAPFLSSVGIVAGVVASFIQGYKLVKPLIK